MKFFFFLLFELLGKDLSFTILWNNKRKLFGAVIPMRDTEKGVF